MVECTEFGFNQELVIEVSRFNEQVGDRGLSTVREHTVVSGGVHGPAKGILKRPGLQKSSTSHRGKPIYKAHINFISWKNSSANSSTASES